MRFYIEHTDTFAGEANYSWVHCETIEAPSDISDSALIRRAKAAIGTSGMRHTKDTYDGDTIELRYPGACLVTFIVADWDSK